MKAKYRSLALMLLATTLFAAPAAAAALNPPFDLPSPRKGGKQSSCEAPPPPVTELATGSIYQADDPTKSKIDPEAKKRYDAAIAPLRDFNKKVAQMASRYVNSDGGDGGAAKCTVGWLASWAKGGALTRLITPQAGLSATRIVAGVAFSWMEVGVTASAEDKAAVDAWLRKLAEATMPLYGNGHNHISLGNHRYWGGLAVGAVAIAVGDKSMFDWAMDSYRLGVCQVDKDGALPIELIRGDRARDYHIHAVAPLVMLAEMGVRNGLDSYDECGGALHRLVKFVLTAIGDPTTIDKLAGATQIPLTSLKSRLAWVAVYRSRFPLPVNVPLPEGLKSSTLGGDVDALYGG
jgi:poly(beta-D-mannuronate) lyase